MGPAHVRAYDHLGGCRSLWTSLNMTVVNLLGVTHSDSQRCHSNWYCFFLRLRDGYRRASCTEAPPLGLGTIASDSWAVGPETVAVATHLCLLGRDRPTDTDRPGWVIAPQMRSYRPSVPDPTTANSICWRPLASRQLVSSDKWSASCLRKLAQCS